MDIFLALIMWYREVLGFENLEKKINSYCIPKRVFQIQYYEKGKLLHAFSNCALVVN